MCLVTGRRITPSERIVHDGEVVQPAGLRCVRLMLVDRHDASLMGGAGWCGEVEGDFAASGVAATDGSDVEVLLWGRAPEDAARVELTARGEPPRDAALYEGPAGFDGDVWSIAAPHTLEGARVTLIREGGGREATVAVSDQLEQGDVVEATLRERERR